ncbi:deoxyribose-phosphate aldolase [Candidatus Kaistella beijingensis]|mgnify:FL=1|uniref:deoxyribose-phosphate aldolase n=1 Tax=Candidatus Kaistella beijingensis TaxID=2820270 RepID=UPI001CC663E9|nr:deoxyribose-phosphate aldolase [Candidatus Kaistella beijingensis]UBB90862.1 deoxyribose-phosphate aldolase [Candidatus Kaistella beijingensis]HOB24662.1 deoxyribose-phosphate aldolase [Kaistella sp.]HQD44958.1 deoxyribose-phosphate aldolase [Kaistella sp.]
MEKVLEKNHKKVNQNHTEERNEGLPFNTKYFDAININRSAIERRVGTLTGRRSVKKEFQAAWLLKAISMIDLTTLAGDDTRGNVLRLCEKAKHPVREDILQKLGMQDANLTTGAVCVYHNLIPYAKEALKGTNIPIAAVSTGFPAGKISLEEKITEIKKSVAAGAKEIDIVISRDLVLESKWKELYEEIKLCRQACGDAHMKTILATGEIPTYTKVAKASWVAMMAGSDFIKTSTGKESVNATLAVSLVMIRCIREYYELTGVKVGYKPAGGIQKAKQALDYLILIKEELGNEWLNPDLFRFGASSLLGDIERQLEHYVTGRYSANFRHPMA